MEWYSPERNGNANVAQTTKTTTTPAEGSGRRQQQPLATAANIAKIPNK